ncbi:MAG TPA: hypothetical protein VK427_24250, partial [Kofleriaceae bacterium]|nr:hypothetical protein [Kofleriaceae bacterium]
MTLATPALAEETPGSTATPTAEENLPKATSDNDPAPPVAAPAAELPDGGIVKQAGIGGMVGYGRAGVLELGGSAGFQFAENFRTVNVQPSIGWFVADNLELSAFLGITNIKADESTATVWSALVEPSYHVPLNRSMFVFGGLGIGAAYVNDLGTGLAIAPRIGANFMVGRSGVLTPALSYEYTTHDVETETSGDMRSLSTVSVSSTLR